MNNLNHIIGRKSEITELKSALATPKEKFEIISVSGMGGVGKTYLLTHVMQQIEPERQGRLVVWVDASAKGMADNFMRIVSEMMAPLHIRGISHSIKKDFFPQVRKLEKTYRAECDALLASLGPGEQETNSETLELTREAIQLLLRIGVAFNRKSNGKRRVGNVLLEQSLEQATDKAFDFIQKFCNQDSKLPGVLQDWFGQTYTRKVRTQLFDVASEALMGDLTAMLRRWQTKDIAKLTQSKVRELDRLLLVIDDFEILGKTLSPFLLGHFLPALRSADFSSQVIILCRDSLVDADPGFEQHFATDTRLKISLSPFPSDDAVPFLVEAGYSEEKARAIYNDCRGLPFLLTAFAEGSNQSALFYQRIFERTTRWMTDEQKEWLIALCYLDEVNEDSVSAMLPDHKAKIIVEWFSHEASVRQQDGLRFAVNPLIREMVLQHHRNLLGARSQETWKRRGLEACAAV
jgi:hypothetical protein